MNLVAESLYFVREDQQVDRDAASALSIQIWQFDASLQG